MESVKRIVATALLCLVLLPSVSSAEMTREKKNLVGGELLGRGVFITVNYERYVTDILSGGLGLFGLSSSDGAVFVIPLYAAATIGDPHSLYLSGGVTIFGGSDFDNPGDNTESTSTPVLMAGYQFMAESGFYVRPAFTYLSEFGLVWPGISIGGSF